MTGTIQETGGLNLYKESLLISMEWSTRSNSLRKSTKSVPIISPLSMHVSHWSEFN